MTGAPRVQPLAGRAWQAAWDIHDWTDGNRPDLQGCPAIDVLEDLRGKLRNAAKDFANAVRKETAG